MPWVYRNVMPGRKPPCPVCQSPEVHAPSNYQGKYRCANEECRTAFHASWKTDEGEER